MQMSNREIGSTFYELTSTDVEFELLSKSKRDVSKLSLNYFYTGRNAFVAVMNDIMSRQKYNSIWLPKYYCDTVIKLFQNNYNNIRFYDIDPFSFNVEIDVIAFASPNDIVILNNFWGLSSFKDYNDILLPIIIEDHSHGWLSKASLNSKADYCICSLRKTLPIPLGAIAWCTNRNFIPKYDELEVEIDQSYQYFETSFRLKREFLQSNLKSKEDFLELSSKAENLLNLSKKVSKPKDSHITLWKKYLEFDTNIIKKRNLDYMQRSLEITNKFKVVKRNDYIPFGLLLAFKNESNFNSLKKWLISHSTYPAHLWPGMKNSGEWKFLLNIHIDFRYNIEDMCYLVEKINKWIKNDV